MSNRKGTVPEPTKDSRNSGVRFSARNVPFYSSVREVLSHHRQLLQAEPAIATRYVAVGSSRGTLLQTTIRFRSDHENVSERLQTIFADLFRQSRRSSSEGFEVIVTFNAVVSDSSNSAFSVFYGHDYGSAGSSAGGVRRDLRYGASYLVQTPDDVTDLPTTFDFESLAANSRLQFENSDLRVVRFLNIVYLAYQYRGERVQNTGQHGGQ